MAHKHELYADGDNIFLIIKEGSNVVKYSLFDYIVYQFSVREHGHDEHGIPLWHKEGKIEKTSHYDISLDLKAKTNIDYSEEVEEDIKFKLKKVFKDNNFYQDKLSKKKQLVYKK